MNKHLSRKPYHLNESVWIYEESNGITIVHEVRVKGEYMRTDQFTIPIKKTRLFEAEG